MRSAALCMPRLLSSGPHAGTRPDVWNGPTLAANRTSSQDVRERAGPRARRRAGALLGFEQARAKAQDGLRVQLGDARLGDAEDLADLAQRQVLVVVERDDQLLALGQAGDRVGDA